MLADLAYQIKSNYFIVRLKA